MSAGLAYFKYSLGGNRIFAIYDGQGEIAQVPVSKYNPMRSEDFARLFSAAPDLLAALKALAKQTAQYGHDDEIADACSAIFKAEGKP